MKMKTELADICEIGEIAELDCHIPRERLEECIRNGQVYVLKDNFAETDYAKGSSGFVAGVLRYSLFWQTIPFLDLIYLAQDVRGHGFGTEMIRLWENDMKKLGYDYVMTSTQADETAWKFYEKLGYVRVGGFFPPEQEAEEIVYVRNLKTE